MTILNLIIAITCSNPKYYTKFNSDGANDGLMITRCENVLKDCYNYSGDIKYCLKELRGL
jgi:hypothetical protein